MPWETPQAPRPTHMSAKKLSVWMRPSRCSGRWGTYSAAVVSVAAAARGRQRQTRHPQAARPGAPSPSGEAAAAGVSITAPGSPSMAMPLAASTLSRLLLSAM